MKVAWKLVGSKQEGSGVLDYPLKKKDRISITGKDGKSGLISDRITDIEYDKKGGVCLVTTKNGIFLLSFV